MDVSVMVEQVKDNGYRATALVPTPLMAEAPTRDEALERIRSLITERFSRAELVHVQVPLGAEGNPWLTIAGTWCDSEVDEVSQNIEVYRREIDADPDRL